MDALDQRLPVVGEPPDLFAGEGCVAFLLHDLEDQCVAFPFHVGRKLIAVATL